MTEPLMAINYASKVSCGTVHIASMVTVLDNLEIKAMGILNVHIIAPNVEKVLTILNLPFGVNEDDHYC